MKNAEMHETLTNAYLQWRLARQDVNDAADGSAALEQAIHQADTAWVVYAAARGRVLRLLGPVEGGRVVDAARAEAKKLCSY